MAWSRDDVSAGRACLEHCLGSPVVPFSMFLVQSSLKIFNSNQPQTRNPVVTGLPSLPAIEYIIRLSSVPSLSTSVVAFFLYDGIMVYVLFP